MMDRSGRGEGDNALSETFKVVSPLFHSSNHASGRDRLIEMCFYSLDLPEMSMCVDVHRASFQETIGCDADVAGTDCHD